MGAKVQKKNGLTLQQEKFCRLYVSEEFYGNGVRSYAEAYGLDINEKKDYGVAMVNSSKLLRKTNITARINELLDLAGFNDMNVDKQHLFLINQQVDLKVKLGAIREYNALKKRVDALGTEENPIRVINVKPIQNGK